MKQKNTKRSGDSQRPNRTAQFPCQQLASGLLRHLAQFQIAQWRRICVAKIKLLEKGRFDRDAHTTDAWFYKAKCFYHWIWYQSKTWPKVLGICVGQWQKRKPWGGLRSKNFCPCFFFHFSVSEYIWYCLRGWWKCISIIFESVFSFAYWSLVHSRFFPLGKYHP